MKKTRWRSLGKNIIAVAEEGECGDWAAYIGVVEGKNYEKEWPDVRDNGSKLPREVAEVLFPDFNTLRWRD